MADEEQTQTRVLTDEQDVKDWRCQRLMDAGVSPVLASLCASTSGLDIHRIISHIEHGCDPAVAVRIELP